VSAEQPSQAEKRTLERTTTPGVFRRGRSYVVVYRFEGKQRKKWRLWR